MFGMKSAPETGSVTSASVAGGEHTNPPEPHGFVAAATAAGFFVDWSTIRFVMMRGWESMTSPDVCWYVVPASAARKVAGVRRGKSTSAAPNRC